MKLVSGHRLLISVWQMIIFALLLLGLLWLRPAGEAGTKQVDDFKIIIEKTVY